MMRIENERLEYKRELTEVVKKEVIAFANTLGGDIYIGIDDDGSVVGVAEPDDVMLRTGAMLRDAIHPDIMMFVRINNEIIEQQNVVHVTVSEGANKPYYLQRYGLKPTGVFIRQGSATVQASSEQIRRMIKEADGDVFEAQASLEQTLTFEKTQAVFAAHGLPLGKQQMQTLGLLRQDGLYTNLALLLSEQCPFTIKAAVFRGTEQSEFQDRKEFRGSLLAQLEACYGYLQLNNELAASFQGLYRQDKRAYPDVAIREALLNCIVHRDYAISASTLISVYADRMEFISLGGLMPGIQKEDILLGVSVCRNKRLAEVFYRLELIEAYGTGLQKIYHAYRDYAKKPQLLLSPHAFKIILPRMVHAEEVKEKPSEYVTPEAAVRKYLQTHATITRKEVERLTSVSMATAIRLLKNMTEQGILLRQGRGKNTEYSLSKK